MATPHPTQERKKEQKLCQTCVLEKEKVKITSYVFKRFKNRKYIIFKKYFLIICDYFHLFYKSLFSFPKFISHDLKFF